MVDNPSSVDAVVLAGLGATATAGGAGAGRDSRELGKGGVWSQGAVDAVVGLALRQQWGEVEAVVRRGFPVNMAKSSIGGSLMHATAAAGHAPTLRLLLSRGASVHTRDVWGYTPLYLAAFKGTPDAVGVLLQAGSDVNRADSSGQTPLMALARWGQGTDELGRLQLLLEHPRVNLTTRYQGKTPREWAMGRGALAVAAAIDEVR